MRRLGAPILLALSLPWLSSGCGQRGAAADAASPQPTPAPSTPSAPAVPATTATATAEPARPPYRFAFATANARHDDDARVVDWGEDGCGRYPVVQVETIPLRDPWLRPDWVVEFDAQGREIARWGRPMAAELIGLDAGRLLFRVDAHGQRGEFATDTAGTLQPLSSDAASLYRSARQLECPQLPSFAESDYAQCFLIQDAAGNERRLAWEAPCT